MRFEIIYDTNAVYHERFDYNVLELLGDIGGIQNVLEIAFGTFFFAIGEFNFLLSVFNSIFILNKEDKLQLFNQTSEKFETTSGITSIFSQRTKKIKHLEIDFSMRSYIELFLL